MTIWSGVLLGPGRARDLLHAVSLGSLRVPTASSLFAVDSVFEENNKQGLLSIGLEKILEVGGRRYSSMSIYIKLRTWSQCLLCLRFFVSLRPPLAPEAKAFLFSFGGL